jgi:uncharacterized protein YecA (UPF0149 family)
MARDRFSDRFRKKEKNKKLNHLADRTRDPDELASEEEMIANAEKVEPIKAETEPGRNDPCPCGSGKKFKKCCGANK